jgi:hypothetical protein
MDGAGSFLVQYGPTSNFNPSYIVLSDFELAALPADFNGDGAVDAVDYVVWRKSDGSQAGYNTWRAHFGERAGSGSVATADATVPEPTTLELLILATLSWFLRRDRTA